MEMRRLRGKTEKQMVIQTIFLAFGQDNLKHNSVYGGKAESKYSQSWTIGLSDSNESCKNIATFFLDSSLPSPYVTSQYILP